MRIQACLLLLLVAGCSGPPTRFYTLAPVPPRGMHPAVPACARGSLTVHHVLLPETLDRQSIVRAIGPDRVSISNQDRWAAPLDSMVQRVLAEDLRDRLPPGRVLAPGDPAPPGGISALDVNIRRFMADNTGQVTLQADWTLLDRHGARVVARTETTQAEPSADASVAPTMSRAVAGLADRIVATLPACPGRARAGSSPGG